MRYAMMVLTLLSASALCSGTGHCADAANTSFFNGKDTEGWEGLSQYWSVKDGALVGSTFPNGLGFNTFLCSKNKYTDFELQFKVRLRGKGWNGNSGVQIRSKIRDSQ